MSNRYVFWFGDLNFRLTGDDSPEEVRELVEKEKIAELVQRDQLLLVRETGKAFHQLEERLPAFPPTFKFKENTSIYDMKWAEYSSFLHILIKISPFFIGAVPLGQIESCTPYRGTNIPTLNSI